MALKDIILHPLTAAATIGSALLAILPAGAPLWEFLGSTANVWFTPLAVFASTILPNIGYPQLGTTLLVSGAVVYVLIGTERFIDRTMEYLRK